MTVVTLPPFSQLMDGSLDQLVPRLRSTDSFTALAAVIIDTLGELPDVSGVAIEAHDRDGPCLWLGSPGFDADAARRYLNSWHVNDTLLARVRVAQIPIEAPGLWLCPILGCGELHGVIRVRVGPGRDWLPVLLALSLHASVRLAQLGGLACEALGASVLTPRQHEVALLVARGATNAEIARLLAISANAVKKHVSRALDLLEVANRTELAAIASQWSCAPPIVLSPAIRVLRRPCISGHFARLRPAA